VVVAPIASLAPAFTVVWAWFVLHERVSRLQLAGLVLALVGLALAASG
jgi:drug/metabolite transporter (DMT)-like permease